MKTGTVPVRVLATAALIFVVAGLSGNATSARTRREMSGRLGRD